LVSTSNRSYYDAFAERYDRGRDEGYHKLIDDQAAELVRRVGEGRDVLEVGCGTGLVLQRVAQFARSAKGIDLSPGMLEHESFDVAYSFKVLAHIPDLPACLREMMRVVRPGGHLVFDAYNRASMRYLIKRWWGPRSTSHEFDEAAITTRFSTDAEIAAAIPPPGRIVDTAGIRVLTPHPAALRVPVVGGLLRAAEWRLMDSPLRRFAGFTVYTVEKPG
jgi:ubiquinone/menaquinone biosynthesis C-methylase UbiE